MQPKQNISDVTNFLTGRSDIMSRNGNDDIAVRCALLLIIPFILTYGDFGVRYVSPSCWSNIQYYSQTVFSWSMEVIGVFVDTTKITNILKPAYGNFSECVTFFLYDELNVIGSLIQFVRETYVLLLKIANTYCEGMQHFIIDVFNLLKDVLLLVISDLLSCIKLLIVIPYSIFNFGFGVWEILNMIWSFITIILPIIGRFVYYLFKVCLRILFYFYIYRFAIHIFNN